MLTPALTSTNILASNDNGPANNIKNFTITTTTDYRYSANLVICCLDSSLDDTLLTLRHGLIITLAKKIVEWIRLDGLDEIF
jgi:hypothetical protein